MSTLTFNHAMIYSRDVDAALRFYRDFLGFKLLEDFRHEERCVYARLKAPRGNATIALHQIEPGKELHPGAIRLYFETDDLRRFLQIAGKGWRQAHSAAKEDALELDTCLSRRS